VTTGDLSGSVLEVERTPARPTIEGQACRSPTTTGHCHCAHATDYQRAKRCLIIALVGSFKYTINTVLLPLALTSPETSLQSADETLTLNDPQRSAGMGLLQLGPAKNDCSSSVINLTSSGSV
jgi:hypothetical protein